MYVVVYVFEEKKFKQFKFGVGIRFDLFERLSRTLFQKIILQAQFRHSCFK